MQAREKRQKIGQDKILACVNFEYLESVLAVGANRYSSELFMVANAILHPGMVGIVFPPGLYDLDDEHNVLLQCYVSVRQDDYGVLKMDLVSVSKHLATGRDGLSWVAPVITVVKNRDATDVICKDKSARRVGKVFDYTIQTGTMTEAEVRLTIQKDSEKLVSLVKSDVRNMKDIAQFNVRGPAWHVMMVPAPRVCTMLTLERLRGADMWNSVSQNMPRHFRNFEYVMDQYDKRAIGFLGTDRYAAPEVVTNHQYSFKSDIYSLGLALRLIWGDRGFLIKQNIKGLEAVLHERQSKNWEATNRFPARSDVLVELYQEIQKILMAMTALDLLQRYSLEDCIDISERICLDNLLTGVADQPEKARITKAFETATLFASKSRKYSIMHFLALERLQRFQGKLHKYLQNLEDNPSSVNEFCTRQNEDCLQGCVSLTDLRGRINGVIDGFNHACLAWQALRTKMLNLPGNEELLRRHAIFTNKIDHIPLHLDVLSKETVHIYRKIAKLELDCDELLAETNTLVK